MKLVRVHNPSRIAVAKKKGKTMAARRRRRTTTRRKARRVVAANPRRRRRRHSRRRNPVIVARAPRRRRRHHAAAPRRRRRHSRRFRNPSGLRVGQIFKDMVYGAGGAILTRTGTAVLSGFVPGAFAGSAFIDPALQAVVAVTLVRWAGKKFMGPAQGDIMMLGGLISAGLSAADKFLPNIQGQLTNIVRAPIQTAPQAAIPVQGGGLGDVYDVDMQAAGFGRLGDVYDVDQEVFQ